jgi:hypothetical protein
MSDRRPMTVMEYEWKRCRPWIEAAMEYSLGSYTIDDVWAEIQAGSWIFWPGENCAMVFQFQTFPRKKWFHGVFCGGDLEEIKAMQPRLLSFAKHCGCDGITIAGRQGWGRALRDLGWQTASHGFVRLVEDDREGG